ncbi:heparinase II/III domain-containing protein [Serinibacter arcticus]|uniref:heparinase II/III domain-containing protein n=1 Tax=Serinibacter arcticus TaxID=1655435 RepID=UPI0013052AC1|nr:heparinase II/III family protein [Serinibacter arcticus]
MRADSAHLLPNEPEGNGADVRPEEVRPQISDRLLEGVAADLLASRRAVPLHQLLAHLGRAAAPSLTTLDLLCRELRSQGYLRRALEVAERVNAVAPTTGARRRVSTLASEIAVLEGGSSTEVVSRDGWRGPVSGSVLLVMGRSLPDVDTNYARHLHAVAVGLAEMGLRAEIVTELGYRATQDAYRSENVDGVVYHRLPGPVRGEASLEDWLHRYSQKLATVVRKVRPAVLVAGSDFLNVLPALSSGDAFDLPVVYDVSGDWDASWYRRTGEPLGWPSPEELALSSQGLPDRFLLRRRRERSARNAVSHVVVSSASSSVRSEVERELGESGVPSTTVDKDPIGTYAQVLESLGAVPQGLRSLVDVRADSTSRVALTRRAETLRRPLEGHVTLDKPEAVAELLSDGWRWNGLHPVSMALPMDWWACSGNRSQDFRYQAWKFMGPVLREDSVRPGTELLDWCHERALDWCATAVDRREGTSMVWYDMALALRAPLLAYLFEHALSDSRRTQPEIDALHRAVVAHQRAFLAPGAFNPATNHGFYTAIGQLAFARRLIELPGMSDVLQQGQQRLRQVVDQQFAKDGGHREHSPDYHRMLVDSFVDAAEDGLIEDESILALIERSAHVTGWFIRPDGEIEQIGDSMARLVASRTRSSRDPATSFIVSRGKSGAPPTEEMLVLPESGYAIVRAPRPTTGEELANSSYLTLMAAFHSRTHKHADDLAVTWFDGGAEILIDSGRFGYLDPLPEDHPDRALGFFYSRPERQYVESTPAHSTVSADGRDHDRRDRKPYGAAVVSGRHEAGVFVVEGEVDHGHWRHHRVVRLAPGLGLDIRDEVESLDGEPHTFTTWWNMAGGLTLNDSDHNSLRFGRDGGSLVVDAVDGGGQWDAQRGRHTPLLGWRSHRDFELEPCWNVSRSVFSRHHVFETSFRLGSAR